MKIMKKVDSFTKFRMNKVSLHLNLEPLITKEVTLI